MVACGSTGKYSRRMLKKAVQQGRIEHEAMRTLRYVEPLSDARTELADFFSLLLKEDTRGRYPDR